MPGSDAKKDTIDELLDVLSARSIMGDPMEIEDKIIIPAAKIGMGFGTDMSCKGRDASKEGPERCAAAGGVGIFPVAVVVVFKRICRPEGVKVIALSPPQESVKFPGMDMRFLVGREIKAGDRAIWPVMRVSILRFSEDKVLALQITPLALLIIEPVGEYAVSFDGEPMTVEDILELAASLRDVLEKARGVVRIKVD